MIAVVYLWPFVDSCAKCGVDCDGSFDLPMYEGKIVDTAQTDDWAGFNVCEACFELHSPPTPRG